MTRIIALLAGLSLAIVAVSRAETKTVYVPAADQPPPEMKGPGGELVIAHCSGCHSLDYVTTQPRGMGAQFWRDAVNKMIRVYKAPIEADDSDAIAATLATEFG